MVPTAFVGVTYTQFAARVLDPTAGAALLRPGSFPLRALYKATLPLMVAGFFVLGPLDAGNVFAILFPSCSGIAPTLFMLVALATTCHRHGIAAL